VIDKLESVLRAESSSVITGDGVKAIIDEDSWILVRPSNTEHAIRVSVESKSGKAEQLYKKASERVQSAYDQIK
jgi:phosphomannomutase